MGEICLCEFNITKLTNLSEFLKLYVGNWGDKLLEVDY
jgi:hypothetical protein